MIPDLMGEWLSVYLWSGWCVKSLLTCITSNLFVYFIYPHGKTFGQLHKANGVTTETLCLVQLRATALIFHVLIENLN